MLSQLFDSSTIGVLEQVIHFAQARHQVLASNIANADTPGYRVRDLPPEQFQARLKDAIRARDQCRATLPISQSNHMASNPVTDVSDEMKSILYHDDSNGSTEHQIAEIIKNQTQHNMAIAIMTSQFRLLQTAISERA